MHGMEGNAHPSSRSACRLCNASSVRAYVSMESTLRARAFIVDGLIIPVWKEVCGSRLGLAPGLDIYDACTLQYASAPSWAIELSSVRYTAIIHENFLSGEKKGTASRPEETRKEYNGPPGAPRADDDRRCVGPTSARHACSDHNAYLSFT